MKKIPKKCVSVMLSADTYDILLRCAAKDSRSMSGEIRMIVNQYIKNREEPAPCEKA